jgi:hypothetical protein
VIVDSQVTRCQEFGNTRTTGSDPVTPEIGQLDKGDIMAASEASRLGTQLDEDHVPETNGRMAVCRRCGFRTAGVRSDRHAPVEAQEAKANRWLDAQALASRVAKARGALDT